MIGRPNGTFSYDNGPDGIGRHNEHPTHIYPVVIHQGATVRLETTEIEGLDLAVQAPVTQVTLGQDRKTVPGLHNHNLRASRQTSEPILLAGYFAHVLGDEGDSWHYVINAARVGKMAAHRGNAHASGR
jgi:hypothetical protein